ncbi:hypothetical protein WMF04_33115 [Sorangium sp. So ce260]|uniref:hypothetical protein n=1 Tax=Sorangium sp. So ce260 TaxID=3133291 RepID=UPI003F5FD992
MAAKAKSSSKPFRADVQTYRSRLLGPCPTNPQWLLDLCNNGTELDLNAVILQAGRHFADSLVPDVIPGSGSVRQKAGQLAEMLIAMVRPRVVGKRLWVKPPKDQDIQRLCSELLGVGAGIELLNSSNVVDMRTVRKVSSTFDFTGRKRGGTSAISLEFKGTVNNASLKDHRKSFRGKLSTSGLIGPPSRRSHNQAIGIIFSAWVRGKTRGADFEIMDPGEDGSEEIELTVREVIRYYARRYDEIVGVSEAAKRLWALADRSDLLVRDAPLDSIIGTGNRPGVFSRAALTVTDKSGHGSTYWGAFWQAEYVRHHAVSIAGLSSDLFPYAYVGIDNRVIFSLRKRQFNELLNLNVRPQSFVFGDNQKDGIGIVLADGTVIVWSIQIPPSEISIEEAT